MGSIFRFKQFEVDQSDCAMKINTDGVLLATLAAHHNPQYLLDVGTGTGVIALMLAQRFPQAKVAAVEIDAQASATAGRNFQSSVFSERLACTHTSIQQYHAAHQFDLIVSNPPYFVNDLKNPEEKKGIARHTNAVFFDELIAKVSTLLSADGLFWFILPIKQAELLVKKAEEHQLFVHQVIYLHSDQRKPAFRRIVCLGKQKVEPTVAHFYIYESEKVYTRAYQELLKEFFLGY